MPAATSTSDQAGRSRRAGRAGALDPAHQGAARHGAGAGGAARGVEPDARAARRGPGRRDRAARHAQAVPLAAGRRADRVRRRRAPAREPPARDHRRVLRPARLHRLRRDRRARGGDGRAAPVPRGARRADLPPSRARSSASSATAWSCCSTIRCRAPIPRRARCGWRSRCARASPRSRTAGASRATSSASASASRRATPRSGTIGFEGRSDYAAIGPVANLASRLCDEAGDGEILVSQRVLDGGRGSGRGGAGGRACPQGLRPPGRRLSHPSPDRKVTSAWEGD